MVPHKGWCILALMLKPLITSLHWVFRGKAGKAELCARQFSLGVRPRLQRKLNPHAGTVFLPMHLSGLHLLPLCFI